MSQRIRYNFSWRSLSQNRRILILSVLCTLTVFRLFPERNNILHSFKAKSDQLFNYSEDPLIILITPTYYRLEQLADLTRLSQTLRLVRKLHWIVIEDNNSKSASIEKLLMRSTLKYTHLYFGRSSDNRTEKFGKGWVQRDWALKYLRSIYKSELHRNAVVYFADDDNSYDIRLFDDYIRHVKTVGVWAVGMVGWALVEAPRVENGTVVGFNVEYGKDRMFALDMAGFAVHLRLILSTEALFVNCSKKDPENCFIGQLNITRQQLQPFGCEGNKKELFVWHTKTTSSGSKGSNWSYVV